MNESWQEVAEEKHSETAHGNNLPKTFQFVKSDNKYKKREKLADTEVSPSRVGSPDLEHGPARLRAEELPLFDDAVSMDSHVESHTNVGVFGTSDFRARNQLRVVTVLDYCLGV